jgi:glycosyltransferase involved in cell wall biosynthesis
VTQVRAFVFFRDSPPRRAALATQPGAAERYALFGLDELGDRGVQAVHNLETTGPPPRWARAADSAINRVLDATGAYGGDFASVLPHLAEANRADVVFSTVDTVGIPLLLLQRSRLVRAPLVYTSIGLPERLERLRGKRVITAYRRALQGAAAIIAYSEHECSVLRETVGTTSPTVTFVPFGVDVSFFRPVSRTPDVDIVSVGIDPRRDFQSLVGIAERNPRLSVRIVCSRDHQRLLGHVPANVQVEVEIDLRDVHARFASARVVALPVQENTYSGATTTLLQAMAMAKPVVVSRTKALERGYGLVDGENCRLVTPGDETAFEGAVRGLLDDPDRARALGTAARATVEQGFTWDAYVDAVATVLRDAARRR